jgi:hypothetical protein
MTLRQSGLVEKYHRASCGLDGGSLRLTDQNLGPAN